MNKKNIDSISSQPEEKREALIESNRLTRCTTKTYVLFSLLSCICVVKYAIDRIIKDTVLLKSRTFDSTGETLELPSDINQMIKICLIPVLSLLFVKIYHIVAKKFGRVYAPIIMVLPFIIVPLINGLIVIPHDTIRNALAIKTGLLKSDFILFRFLGYLIYNWSAVANYGSAEMFGSGILVYAVWELSTLFFTTTASRSIIPFMVIVNNLANLASGISVMFYSLICKDFTEGSFGIAQRVLYPLVYIFRKAIYGTLEVDELSESVVNKGLVTYASTISCLLGLSFIGIVFLIIREMRILGIDVNAHNMSVQSSKKPTPGVKESLRILFSKTKYYAFGLFCTGSYMILAVLNDSCLRSVTNKISKDAVAFSGIQAKQQFFTGFAAMVGIFISSQIMKRFGWTVAAMVPAVFIGGLTAVFLLTYAYLSYYNGHVVPSNSWFICFALIQGILVKALKYANFDDCRASIHKSNGKDSAVVRAATDVICSRFMKAFGGVTLYVLIALLVKDEMVAQPIITPYTGAFALILAVIWVVGVILIGHVPITDEEQKLYEEQQAKKLASKT